MSSLDPRDALRTDDAALADGPEAVSDNVVRTRSRRPGLRGGTWAVGLIAVLAVLPLIDIGTAGILPGTLSSPGSLNLLGLCLLFAALALTYDLLFGFTGLLSFGHALFFAIGTYTAEIGMQHLGLTLVPATIFALLIGLVCSLVVGAISLRVGGIAFAMVTLAFAQAGSIIVNQNPGGLTGGELGESLSFDQVPDFFLGVVNTKNLYWLALGLLVVVYAIVAFATRSAPGRIWVAIRENELRVQILGLRPYSFKLMAFALASVLAAGCGVVYLLFVGGANPSITTPDFTLSLLVMVVLGGAGCRWGAALGGALYSYLSQRLPALASSDAIAGLPAPLRVPLSEPLFILGTLFVLVILFLPGGIAGTVARVRHADVRAILGRSLTFTRPSGQAAPTGDDEVPR